MKRIVVASDGKWVRDLVKDSLLTKNVELVECTTGQRVRGAVANTSPDVVILDLQIGNMGGFATAIDLRLEAAAGRIPETKILLLLDRPADKFLAKRAAVDAHLVKPVDAGTIRETVESLVGKV